MGKIGAEMAQECALYQRLTSEWQDEDRLLSGLSIPATQWFICQEAGVLERRRQGWLKPRWQLRLAESASA
jgi:hypothetical protein